MEKGLYWILAARPKTLTAAAVPVAIGGALAWSSEQFSLLPWFLCLVFALLIHVRLKVKDKGLWTALLAVVGAGVMLFNWIVINFVITGLHSYA